jgi:UDP-glucose 4-epimerase
MCPISCARIAMRWRICAAATSRHAQLRLRRGFPVLEVIETVKRVSGVDFKTRSRAGVLATPAQIVAASDCVRSLLKWQPHFDDLETAVCHAVAWERKLLTRAD